MKKVSIIMGSVSDYEVMSGAEQILTQFGVEYEKKVISAHRTLDFMVEYTRGAKDRLSKYFLLLGQFYQPL